MGPARSYSTLAATAARASPDCYPGRLVQSLGASFAGISIILPGCARSSSIRGKPTKSFIPEAVGWLEVPGRYVALVLNAATGERFVLRDPLGGMPCLLVVYQGVSLIFSDMDACARLGLMRFSVNWNYIRRLVVDCSLQSRETASSRWQRFNLASACDSCGARATARSNGIRSRSPGRPASRIRCRRPSNCDEPSAHVPTHGLHVTPGWCTTSREGSIPRSC